MDAPNSESPQPESNFIIQGVTSNGKAFRPSDWAERLCGIMSQFHPDKIQGGDSHLQYSPYVLPSMLNGIRAVNVDARLRELEPLAFHFLLNFAKDNDLRIVNRT